MRMLAKIVIFLAKRSNGTKFALVSGIIPLGRFEGEEIVKNRHLDLSCGRLPGFLSFPRRCCGRLLRLLVLESFRQAGLDLDNSVSCSKS